MSDLVFFIMTFVFLGIAFVIAKLVSGGAEIVTALGIATLLGIWIKNWIDIRNKRNDEKRELYCKLSTMPQRLGSAYKEQIENSLLIKIIMKKRIVYGANPKYSTPGSREYFIKIEDLYRRNHIQARRNFYREISELTYIWGRTICVFKENKQIYSYLKKGIIEQPYEIPEFTEFDIQQKEDPKYYDKYHEILEDEYKRFVDEAVQHFEEKECKYINKVIDLIDKELKL